MTGILFYRRRMGEEIYINVILNFRKARLLSSKSIHISHNLLRQCHVAQ